MIAVIPIAGTGLRLRPHTYTQPKPLLPVAGKPMISYIVDELLGAEVEEVIFIVGYLGEKIVHFINDKYPELKKSFLTQEERLGSAHAVWQAREQIKQADELLIFFGDAIIETDFSKIFDAPTSCFGVMEVADPSSFGVVEMDEGKVVRVEEKPAIPCSDIAMAGIYKVKEVALFLKALNAVIDRGLNLQQEYYLTNVFSQMIGYGVDFSIIEVDKWHDCGKIETLLQTNAIFLDKREGESLELPSFYNSIIIHPVSIGADCEINNSIIGPHVTIGDHVHIDSTIIKNAIIGDFSNIKEVILQESIIGSDASIIGLKQKLNIGDNTDIDFSL